jgi:hypothetical protein
LAQWFQRRRFSDPLTNMAATCNSCLWLYALLKKKHLWKVLYKACFFKNRSIRNKNCLWWPCLLMDQNDISNRNRGLSIDSSYQVSVHLAKQFQRRRIFKISQSETRIAQMNWNLVWSIYGRSSIKVAHFVPIH